jgi:hypothetical protein
LIPTCPTLTKCYSKVAHAFLYTWMDFFQSNCAKPLLSYLLPYSRTFNCTSKTTGWFTKGAEIDPNLPHANKVLLKVAHVLIYDGLLSVAPTVPKPLLSYLPYSRTFNCTSKTTGWFTKGKLILPHANKVLLQGSTRILIYMDGLLSVAPNCAQAVAILPSSIPERSIALVKRLAGSPKELKLIPTYLTKCYSR